MGILPVLIIIIVVASVVSNYSKLSKQRLEDEKKRTAFRQKAKSAIKAEETENCQAHLPIIETTVSEPVQKVTASSGQSIKPRMFAKDIKRAVIMAEILNKPVSLRDK